MSRSSLGFHCAVVAVAVLAAACSRGAASQPATYSLPDPNGKVDLKAMAMELGKRGMNEVLIEAGTKLNGSLLNAKLVDELIIYLAPHLLGDSARGMFGLPELSFLSERLELSIKEVRQIGADIRVTARTGY